jgi:hypothetical protein
LGAPDDRVAGCRVLERIDVLHSARRASSAQHPAGAAPDLRSDLRFVFANFPLDRSTTKDVRRALINELALVSLVTACCAASPTGANDTLYDAIAGRVAFSPSGRDNRFELFIGGAAGHDVGLLPFLTIPEKLVWRHRTITKVGCRFR